MKTFFLLSIAFLLLQLNSLAQDGWFWQNPISQGKNLNDIWVFDEDNILIVGETGAIIKSVNGGIDWVSYTLLTTYDLLDVHFINENIGWAVGQGKVILKTTNAGEEWFVIDQGVQDTTAYCSVFFIDDVTGWVCETGRWDRDSKLYKTTDSGYSWVLQYSDFNYQNIFDVEFVNEDIGWALTGGSDGEGNVGKILKTTNGGNDWEVQLDAYCAFVELEMIDINSAWVIGDSRGSGFGPSNVILRTTNGGEDWSTVIDFWDNLFTSICFSDSMNGWLAGSSFLQDSAKLYTTNDGGESWFEQESNSPYVLTEASFLDNSCGFIVGANGTIIKTTDGGNDWIYLTKGYTSRFNSVNFINSITGWIVGNSGTILSTTNGGTNWNIQNSNTDVNLHSVSFINSSEGWAVGDSGVILNTTNGGEDWNPQFSNTNNWIISIVMFNSKTGYILGENLFLKTTNGGLDWVEKQLLSYDCITDMYFLNENVGWIIPKSSWGFCGVLQRTTDGGENWQELSSENGNILYFIDNNTGWMLDNSYWGCAISGTIDGGVNWNGLWGDGNIFLTDLLFIDNNLGWVVGGRSGSEDGVILHTTNGGNDWYEQESEVTKYLTSVCFINNLTGWAVGEDGTILHTTNGGLTFIEENEINEISTDFCLTQNFPNPFNPSTKIEYTVTQQSNVVIKIFDILGNEIETLINEEKTIGTYEITWNAESLPSGVYFYQLKAAKFIETKKMVLMK